jgi:trimeric autotransporter adhesin
MPTSGVIDRGSALAAPAARVCAPAGGRWLPAALLALLLTAALGLVLDDTIFTGSGTSTAGHSSVVSRILAQRREATARVLRTLPATSLAAVSRTLGGEEPRFRAQRTASGYRLAGGGIHAQLGGDGLRLRAGDNTATLALLAIGRGGRALQVARASLSAHGNRVTYRRPGLREWYAGGPLGIEQGFTLSARPAGAGALTLQLGLSGLTASPAGRTGAVLSAAGGEHVLTYRGLRATDARGQSLRAWLSLAPGRVLIHVADARARYPLRIDPFVQTAKLTVAEGAAKESLGFWAAMSGRTLVASGGKAEYVFVEPPGGWSGTPHEVAKLTASDGATLENVATSGSTIVAGAPLEEVGGAKNAGAAYVFTEPAGGWKSGQEQAKLTATTPLEPASVGSSVAVSADGHTIVAGAPYQQVGTTKFAGADFVFSEPAGGWSGNLHEQAELAAATSLPASFFGGSVAISGQTIVTGAYAATIGSSLEEGAAYVFTEPPGGWSGTRTEQAKLVPSDGAEESEFGWSVATSGQTIAVGSIQAGTFTEKPGAVYVFEQPAGGWSGELTQQAKLTSAHGSADEELGYSLAISGNLIVAGADRANGISEGQGALYVFTRPAGGWVNGHETARLTASDGAKENQLGQSVGIGVNSIVGAAWFATIGEHEAQGALYAFAIPPPPSIAITAPANGATYTQGRTVAAAYSCAAPPGGSITVCSAPVASGAPIDTATTGNHSLTVSAADSDGFTASQTVTYSVVPAPATPAKPPTLSGLRESYSVFAVAKRSTPLTGQTARRHHKGTTFSFQLDQPATVKVTIQRSTSGRLVHHRCRAASPRLRHRPRCRRTITLRTLTRSGHAGPNRIAFSGRIGRRALATGRYRAVFTAIDAAGKSTAHALVFTIVGR